MRIHYQPGAGIVSCGIPMYDFRKHNGNDIKVGNAWTMENTSVELDKVTCPECLSKVRRGRK